MRRVRALFVVLFAVLLSLVVQGCGDADKPRVILWHAYRGEEETALKQVVTAFEKERNVTVELLALPFDAYATKLESAIPHAHGPDVFIDAHERLGSYLQNTLVAPVGEALDDRALFDEAALAAATVNGTTYGVPLAQKSLALFVNEALVPTEPTSFEALAKRDGLPEGSFPLAYEAESAYFHAPLLHAFGGRMVDADGNFAAATAEGEASIAFLLELKKARAIPDEPNGALVTELFATGKAKAVVSGPWFLADAKK